MCLTIFSLTASVQEEGAAILTEYYQTADANLAEKSEALCFKRQILSKYHVCVGR